jgi:hypothetical protein
VSGAALSPFVARLDASGFANPLSDAVGFLTFDPFRSSGQAILNGYQPGSTTPEILAWDVGAGALSPIATVAGGEAGVAVVLPACADHVDGDGDGAVDSPADGGCTSALDDSEREPGRPCDDGLDNDGDGYVDYPSDPGCWLPSSGFEKPQCQDGTDNDAQPGTDFDGGQSIHGACAGGSCPPGVNDPEGDGVANPDPQCAGKPWHNQEKGSACGLGFELAALLPLLARLGGRRSRRLDATS